MLSGSRHSLRVRAGGSDRQWGLQPLTVCISNRGGLRNPRAWGVLLKAYRVSYKFTGPVLV